MNHNLKEIFNDTINQTISGIGFFLIRAPILTFDLYAQCFPTREEDYEWLRQFSLQQLIQLSNNPIIREAIEASSPSLLEALPSLNNFQYSRKQRQVLKGFVRYLLRMTTRPTPFGLFSGVTYGQFASRAQLNMKNIPFYRKRTRPDMEWLLKIIEQIEKRHEHNIN